MKQRWLKSRWSETRRRMHDMKPGEEIQLPMAEYVNAHSSEMRLNDCREEGEARWRVTKKGGVLKVRREESPAGEQHADRKQDHPGTGDPRVGEEDADGSGNEGQQGDNGSE
jgi:hypothetical protein